MIQLTFSRLGCQISEWTMVQMWSSIYACMYADEITFMVVRSWNSIINSTSVPVIFFHPFLHHPSSSLHYYPSLPPLPCYHQPLPLTHSLPSSDPHRATHRNRLLFRNGHCELYRSGRSVRVGDILAVSRDRRVCEVSEKGVSSAPFPLLPAL